MTRARARTFGGGDRRPVGARTTQPASNRIHRKAPSSWLASTCGRSGAEQGQPSSEGRSSNVLDGIFRNQITVEEMVAAGVNEADARDNAGVHTIKLSNGRLHDTLIPDAAGVEGVPDVATYRLSGHTSPFTWSRTRRLRATSLPRGAWGAANCA